MKGVKREDGEKKRAPKKYIGVHFECCGVYRHVYHDPGRNAYVGRCPLCRREVKVLVDPERGIDARFFRAR
ncbi:MAG: hypothetical protein AB1742_07650 [bacterium]